MKVKQEVLAVIALVGSGIGFAGTMGPVEPLYRGVITISGGPAWTNPGQTQSVLLLPSLSQLYVATSQTHTIGSGEVTLSLQRPVAQHLIGQLGLAVAAATSIPLNGVIWQDNDPDFNNFTYAYKITHAHIALRGKVLADYFELVQPYLSASIGVGFNRTYQFMDIPNIIEVSPEPPFQDNTNTTFVYTLDAGIQKNLNDYWSVGVGYEFADWGKSQLNPANNQTAGNGLAINHIYVNQLLFNVSFIA